MSYAVSDWVFTQDAKSSSSKLVLLALAHRANKVSFKSWPSVREICDLTHLNRKTVLSSIQKLLELKLLVDTGERRGMTGQVVVFSFKCVWEWKESQKRDRSKSPKNGTVDGETVPFLPPNSPVFTSKSPKNGIRNRREQEMNRGEGPLPFRKSLESVIERSKQECHRLLRAHCLENSLSGRTWNPPSAEEEYNEWRKQGADAKAKIRNGEYIV